MNRSFTNQSPNADIQASFNNLSKKHHNQESQDERTTLKENSVLLDSKLSQIQPPALKNVYFTNNHVEGEEFKQKQANKKLVSTPATLRQTRNELNVNVVANATQSNLKDMIQSRMIEHKRLVGMVKSNYKQQLMMKGHDLDHIRDKAYKQIMQLSQQDLEVDKNVVVRIQTAATFSPQQKPSQMSFMKHEENIDGGGTIAAIMIPQPQGSNSQLQSRELYSNLKTQPNLSLSGQKRIGYNSVFEH